MSNAQDLERDQALMTAARAELEQAAKNLDTRTRTRLHAARIRALATTEINQPVTWWVPASAVAAVIAIVATVSQLQIPTSPVAEESIEWMSTLDGSYELYENLEFYEWLETEADDEHV